jgi:hypothetical protein
MGQKNIPTHRTQEQHDKEIIDGQFPVLTGLKRKNLKSEIDKRLGKAKNVKDLVLIIQDLRKLIQ